jgi:stress response protein SCP2
MCFRSIWASIRLWLTRVKKHEMDYPEQLEIKATNKDIALFAGLYWHREPESDLFDTVGPVWPEYISKLSKGQSLSLTKLDPDLTKLLFKLNYSIDKNYWIDKEEMYPDEWVTVFLLDASGKLLSDCSLLFWGQSFFEGVSLDYDDMNIEIDLNRVPEDVQTIVIAMTVADQQPQDLLCQLNNFFIGGENAVSGRKLAY